MTTATAAHEVTGAKPGSRAAALAELAQARTARERAEADLARMRERQQDLDEQAAEIQRQRRVLAAEYDQLNESSTLRVGIAARQCRDSLSAREKAAVATFVGMLAAEENGVRLGELGGALHDVASKRQWNVDRLARLRRARTELDAAIETEPDLEAWIERKVEALKFRHVGNG